MKNKRLNLKSKNEKQLLKDIQLYEEQYYLKKEPHNIIAKKNFDKIVKELSKRRSTKLKLNQNLNTKL